MTKVWRWLLERGVSPVRLGERGEVRHVLLILLVLSFVLVVFHWQGKVTCLYHSVATAITTPGGGPAPSC